MKNAIKIIAAVAAFVFAFAAQAATQKVGDYTWSYRIVDGKAEIYNDGDTAISPYPEGAITIPSTLGGKTVVRIGDSAMSYLPLLTSVTMPASVTSIGCYTFNECRNLESVTMPGVKEIDQNAFSSCVSLSSVVMPDDVKILGPAAFAGCPGDESGLVIIDNVVYGGSYDMPSRVVVPDTVTRIADYALSRFFNLKSVLIPGNVKSIGEYAFYESDLGEGVVICDGVEDIGTGAFYNTGLKSIVIPGSVNSIGESAFFRSESLTSATILDGVRTIGDSAFCCYCLTSVSIPPSVTTIGSGGIYGGVETVYVAAGDADHVKEVLPIPDTQLVGIDFVEPSGAYTVTLDVNGGVCGAPSAKVKKGAAAGDLPAAARKDYAFAGWYTAASGGEWVTESTPINGNVTLYAHWLPAPGGELCEKVNGYTWYFRVGDDGNAEIYPGKDGQAVEPSPSGALTIPAKLGGLDVTGIGEYAFQYYDALASVTIPASVTSIGRGAFYGCNSLTSVTLPVRFKDNLEPNVFWDCPEDMKIIYRDVAPTLTIGGGKEAMSRAYSCEAKTGESFSVACSASWTATASDTWITITSGASGSGNGTIKYKLAQNADAQRVGKISVKCGTITRVCTITQDKPLLIGGKTEMARTYEKAAQADCYFSVTCSKSPWTAASSASWITLRSDSKSGTGAGKIYYDVAANSGAQRTAKITVTSRGISRVCTITQKAGGEATLTIGGGKTSMSRGYSCEAKTAESFSVACNGSWTATPSASWITIISGASGSGNGTVKYKLAENTGTSMRSGTIKVKCGSITRTCTITQDKPLLIGGKTSMSRTYAAAKQTGCYFTVTCSQTSWTAVSSASWVTLKTSGGTGTGTLTYDVAANTSSSSRTATIKVTSRGLTRTCTIKQNGK